MTNSVPWSHVILALTGPSQVKVGNRAQGKARGPRPTQWHGWEDRDHDVPLALDLPSLCAL